jgi:NAD(P)-dependent dehydrogenase (short-subunit alcohol dehydrogenase family)
VASGANTVAPGGIVTDSNNAAIRSNPQAQQWIIGQTPMGRLGEAHDIAGSSPSSAAMMPDGSQANVLRRQADSTCKGAYSLKPG